MDDQYVEKMKEWIELDNVYGSLRQQMSDLADKKKELEDDILKYIEENNLGDEGVKRLSYLRSHG